LLFSIDHNIEISGRVLRITALFTLHRRQRSGFTARRHPYTRNARGLDKTKKRRYNYGMNSLELLGLLWIGPLLAMGFAYAVAYYLPFIIVFFASIGTVVFSMFYIIIKILIKNVFCKISGITAKIVTIINIILNVVKIFLSVGSYLLLFGCMIWLGIEIGPSGMVLPILVILFVQLISAVILKRAKKLNDIYLTVFLLIEPYLFLYVLIGAYYSRGLLF
jgi:hypothetical protein